MHERRCANGRIHPGHQPDRPRRARAGPHRAELGQAAGPVALRELRALPRDLLPAGRGAVADAVRSPRARQGPDRAVSELRAPVRRGVEPQPRRRSAGAGAPAPGAQGGGGGGPRPRGGGDQPARGRRRRRQPPGGAPGPLGRRGGQAGPAARLPDAARPGRRLRAAARARRRPLGRVDLPDQHARRRARGAAGPPRSRPRRGAAAPVRPRPGATDRRFDPMMTMDARQRPARVGELRPSQLLSSFGVGATVDLPHLSVMVMGLDDWSPAYTTAVTEERLLAAVRHSLGSQVSALRTAPWLPENDNPFDEWARVGVPVSVFPRWLRCPRCSILAPVSSGLFELKVHPVRTDRNRYEHANCSGARRAPPVLAARFLLACPAGHLDDFPWVEFTHRFAPCADPRLALRETGVSGQASDVQVRCRACGEDAQAKLPRCRGRHPHLATFTPGCDQPVGSILLGASNEWFGVRLRVLSIPARGERLAQLAADHWADLQHVTSPEVLRFARTQPQFGAFAEFGDDDLWAAVEARRSSGGEAPEDPEDLLGPEWAVFSEPDSAPSGGDFQLRAQPPPARFAGRVAQVVLAERLREVQALVGFTRIDAPDELRADPLWVPCAEVRGEGVFLRLAEEPLAAWERGPGRWLAGDALRAGAFAGPSAHPRVRARVRLRRRRPRRAALHRAHRRGSYGRPAAVHRRAGLRGHAGGTGGALGAGAGARQAVQLGPAVRRARAGRPRAARRRLPGRQPLPRP